MKDIKKKDFLKEKTLKVCYIYKTETNEDGTLKNVHYYRYDNNVLVAKSWDIESFANKIIAGEWLAYAGKIEGKEEPVMKNPSLVTVKTIDNKIYLTTASDDDESNNLLELAN